MTNYGAAFVVGTCLGLFATSCADPNRTEPQLGPAPTRESWRHAQQKLAEMGRASSQPRTMRVALTLREPITRRTLEARGALAVLPPDALRMILLGPGGTTSLDLWLQNEQFRFAVPAIDLLRRGDASTPRKEMRGMPVDFLRWWLLRPTSGTLLWHVDREDESWFVLRDGRAIVDLHIAPSGRITARRTTWEDSPDKPSGRRKVDEELIEADRLGCGEVQYQQASTNLRVTVKCEAEDRDKPPNPRAFVDPDLPDARLFLVGRSGRE